MRRRDFIVFLGGTTAWPLAALAEQPTPAARRLGVLMQPSAQAAKARGFLDAFIKALQEAGWVEGQNVIFERRFADGKAELLANLAAELVQLRVDAIVTDSTPSARAAKIATQTVPIVMAASGDAVANGLVASFSRPGGNVTGMSIMTGDLTGRRLQLLTEMVPSLKRVAILMNPFTVSLSFLTMYPSLVGVRYSTVPKPYFIGQLRSNFACLPKMPQLLRNRKQSNQQILRKVLVRSLIVIGL